jgi:hypothetical protein
LQNAPVFDNSEVPAVVVTVVATVVGAGFRVDTGVRAPADIVVPMGEPLDVVI